MRRMTPFANAVLAFAVLPRAEIALEKPLAHRPFDVAIVVSRNGKAWRQFGIAHAEEPSGGGKFGLEPHRRCVAGEDQVVEAAFFQFPDEGVRHDWRVPEPVATLPVT